MSEAQVLRDSRKKMLTATVGAARASGLSEHEANALVREALSSFLLLRWLELAEAEQEAMAVFEDCAYKPLLPTRLQWREWSDLAHPAAWDERVQGLAQYLERHCGEDLHPAGAWLARLVAPLRRMSRVKSVRWPDLLRWVGELPFETPSDRRAILESLDQVLVDTSGAYENQTPTSIARLITALAQPQPGERVYDPCFGFGNLLVAAWQQAERSRQGALRPGPLLDVSGVEIKESAFLIGLTRMLLAGIEHPQLEVGNSLEREWPSSPSRQGFDLVLANPPIGAKVARDASGHQHFAFSTADSVGLFIQHALAQLKPHGRAVIAVPEGFLFRGGAERELRRHLLEHGQVEAVVGLPAGSLAPYTSVKISLLVLRRHGGTDRVRMIDAASLFDARSDARGKRQVPVISLDVAQQLAMDLRRQELRRPVKGVEDATPDRGLISRLLWEQPARELAAVDWDLTPRRREKGGLSDLLASVQAALGDQVAVAPLSNVADVMPGRSIKSSELDDGQDPTAEPPQTGYVRIRDLNQGKVGRPSSWVRREVATAERRWVLRAGDVLLSKSGTIGKVAVVRNGGAGAIAGNGLYVLRADQDRLDPAFLMAYLESPSCQTWLEARARGAVIQHLNRAVLDELPVPLPPMHLQRAAVQFRDHGTDVLTFLIQASESGEAERLTAWLADVNSKLPAFTAGLDDAPRLSAIEVLAATVEAPRRWLDQNEVGSAHVRWLRPLINSLQSLASVGQIPPGPGLLSILQESERAVLIGIEEARGPLPLESHARAVGERLRALLRATIFDLEFAAELRVEQLPEELTAGNAAEFTVVVKNGGQLPLRSVRVRTEPDWGETYVTYLAEGGSLPLTLRGDAPKQGERLTLSVNWQAVNLSGRNVGDTIELAIRIASPVATSSALAREEWGGSPYVTGSPLEPRHGHAVFFGREDLIGQIGRQITQHGNVVLLEGNRRAGKTSILKHLEGHTTIPGWLAVYASLQAAEGASQVVGVPTAEVFRLIAFELAKAVATLRVETPLPDASRVNLQAFCGENKIAKLEESGRMRKVCQSGISEHSPFADFRDYLEILLAISESNGLGIVLMLDEFDKLQEGIDNGVTSPQVPENLRFLIQSYPRFSAILTGSRRLKRLREEYWSALYGLGTSIPVTAIDRDSARRVVTEPVRGRLVFSEEAVDRITELTARQPYLIQCLCNRIFDFASQARTNSVTLAIVEDAVAALVDRNEHFASLWDYAAQGPKAGGRRRQLILLQCALALKRGVPLSFGTLREQLAQLGAETGEAELDVDLAYLRELDLVDLTGEMGDGHYELAIPLLAPWIAQQHDADVIARRARAESEEEHG